MASSSSLLLAVDSGERLPDFGTAEEAAYIFGWEGGRVLHRAMRNIPNTDVAYVRNRTGSTDEDEKIRLSLAINRLSNRICEACCWKPSSDRKHHNRLKLCAACCCAWFCDDACLAKAKEEVLLDGKSTHDLRCCKPQGPLDRGPQAIAIGRVDMKK